MTQKQNIIISLLVHRFGGWGLLLLTLIIGVLGGYYGGHWHVLKLQDEISQQQETIEQLYQRAETFDYQQHIAMVELGIERAASKNLQQELLIAQDENFALRREITFYQKIMAPEMEASGVVIDSLELQKNITPNHFHFRLAIVQMERVRNLTKGTLSITLHGRKNDKPASYDLLDLANIEAKDRQFSMRYFTVQAGDFVLPDDFLPERLDVEVNISGSRQSLTRSFFWSQLLQPREVVNEDGNT
ncbi:DUF6776 family protein [Pseudidiomarina woesei]|uniref:Uncharacterized protein n=1 Tax=Pseudidiomarina woesei TaxID=1381080 RepID=A0A0K6HAI0_9GAMM|nr:DUF6776 family protein [Pseudidiomarina woesei]CUA87979.1 hypothetical protein Ga0061064_2015 [Pseudidiomarina woesei]